MRAFLMGLGTLFTAMIGLSLYFSNKLMYIRKKTEEEIVRREKSEHRAWDTFESIPKEEVWISSPYEYDIHGYYIPAGNNEKFMIFCHGVTMNKLNSVKYGNLFLERGFNVLMYDHRRHGQTGGKTTSYGYYEKHDLQAVVQWLKHRFGSHITIGIHGESMGAATLLQYAGQVEDGADFYIADCPFSDFYEQLVYRLKIEFKLPEWPLLPLANMLLKWRDGYMIQDVSPIDCVQHIESPVLFIHSKEDDYILAHMTEALYERKAGPKQLFIAENGAHAMSYTKNKPAYEQAIDSFLETYVHTS